MDDDRVTKGCDQGLMGKAYPRVALTRHGNRAIAYVLRRRERLGIRSAWLFPSPAPRLPVSKDNAGKWLRDAEAAAGLDPLPGNTKRWHAYRAKYASERRQQPVKQVAYNGGWKNESILVKLYEKLRDSEAYEAAERREPYHG